MAEEEAVRANRRVTFAVTDWAPGRETQSDWQLVWTLFPEGSSGQNTLNAPVAFISSGVEYGMW